METKNLKCGYCGEDIQKRQKNHQYKYCTKSCHYNASFGEIIPCELSNVRNHTLLQAIRLCQSGLTGSEAAHRVGIKYPILKEWFRKYGPANRDILYAGRICCYCGKPLEKTAPMHRKYCSKRCKDKADWDKRKPKAERKYREFDAELRAKGLELYWGGLGGGAIAQHLGIATGTIHSWIHEFGHLQERNPQQAVLALQPVEERLEAAKSVGEWHEILRQAAPEGDATSICLVCGKTSGQAGCHYLAAIVSDVLKHDPCDGGIYAFCSGRQVLTIRWNNGTFFYTKQPKARGRYIWPDAQAGSQIDIRRNEFEYLISLSKKTGKKPDFT